MAGEIYSGRFGSIDNCGQVSQWSLEVTVTDDAQANSATWGAKMRDAGVMDWTGSCTFLGHTFPGSFNWDDSEEIILRTGGRHWQKDGRAFKGKMVWTSAAISGDISNGGRVQCSMSFAGDGDLEPIDSGNAGANGDTKPVVFMAKDCKILWDGEEIGWKAFSFTVAHEAQEYIDSTCYLNEGLHAGQVWKKRVPGIIDCTGTIDYIGDRDLADMNDMKQLKIVCNGNCLLEMMYARYMGTSSITVDPSSGAVLSGQGKFNMAAHSDDGAHVGRLCLYNTVQYPPSESPYSYSGGVSGRDGLYSSDNPFDPDNYFPPTDPNVPRWNGKL